MRKYRYGDPTKVSFFRKYGNFLYFFAAWNLLGMVAWKSMSLNKKTTEESWEEKTSTEKYLSLIGFGPGTGRRENVKHVKIDGLQVSSSPDERG